MASQSFSHLKDANDAQENQNQEQSSDTSGYSSSAENSSSRGRPHHCKCKKGEDIPPSLVKTVLTEADARDISSEIGQDWRRLGRHLDFPEATLESIPDDRNYHSIEDKAHALLIKFIRRNGSNATKGRLAEALVRTGRKDISETLIGTEHFAKKTPDQQIFFLKEQSSFNVPDEDGQPERFFTCQNIDDGQWYLVRKLVGKGYEESCKVLKQQDNIAEFILKALDVEGIVKTDKQKKESQKIREAQEKIVELLKGLQEIANSMENQERKEKRIKVSKQLHEDEALLMKMKTLGKTLLELTDEVSKLNDPFPLEAQMYSFSLGLSAVLRDLEERVRMLREMVPRCKKKFSHRRIETEKFDQLLEWSRTLGEEIRFRENIFLEHFQQFNTLENQQRPRQRQDCSSSDPSPRVSKHQVDVPEIRRGSSQPVCERELRTLREEVAPAPDPIEDEGSLFSEARTKGVREFALDQSCSLHPIHMGNVI